eukprot:TRINITY_DN72490_c0_g1_i1.p1 TRINITY_DN72490_c0_g1~~TRINITY_DN72490_c0_g1_i1.p1  ORF type:complete len:685 (-),score=129.05 TRINITY_DN72490_c0_g1_i1:71-2125(-)
MPRPLLCDEEDAAAVNRSTAVPRATCLDAERRKFEIHLNGLVQCFQSLQQQCYERMVCTSGNDAPSFVSTLAPKATTADATAPPADLELDLGDELAENGANDSSVAAVQGAMEANGDDPNPRSCVTDHIELERRQILSQFARLDQQKQGRIDMAFLMVLMKDFGVELEDLKGLVRHVRKIAPPEISRASTRNVASPGDTTTKGGAEEKIPGMSLDMILALRLDDSILEDPTPKAVQRDAKKLRDALKREDEQALYADDGHNTKKGRGSEIRNRLTLGTIAGAEAVLVESLPACVIAANALCLGLSSDLEKGALIWQVLELVFLLCYSVEAGVKLRLYGRRWYFLGADRYWNWFDFVCLLLQLVDQGMFWGLNIMSLAQNGHGNQFEVPFVGLLKVLRLSRLGRLVRSLRLEVFTELKCMVIGMVSGLRALLWAIALLFVLIYAFGVGINNVIGEEEPEFSTVPNAMFTLFRCFTEGCNTYQGTPLTERLRNRYGFAWTATYVLMFVGISIGMFNLILAVFIDNVVRNQLQRKLQEISNSAPRFETEIKEGLLRMMLHNSAFGIPEHVEDEIIGLWESYKTHGALVRAQFQVLEHSGCVISRSSFKHFLQDKAFCWTLQEADIETSNAAGIFDILDSDLSGWLTVNEVFHGLMRLRGPICKSEIVGIRLRVRHMTQLMHGLTGDD